MSTMATFDGRLLHCGDLHIDLDKLSTIETHESLHTEWKSSTVRWLSNLLGLATLAFALLALWKIESGQWLIVSIFGCSAIVCLLVMSGIYGISDALGLARHTFSYSVVLHNANDDPPIFLFHVADGKFIERVAAVIRDAVHENGMTFTGTILVTDRSINVARKLGRPVEVVRDKPGPSGVDDVRVVDEHLVLAEQVIAFRDVIAVRTRRKDFVTRNKPSPLLPISGVGVFALYAVDSPNWGLQTLVALAAVAFGTVAIYGVGIQRRRRPVPATLARTAVVVVTRQNQELPLFSTNDHDFAEKVAARLDALKGKAGERAPAIVIDWNASTIGPLPHQVVAQPASYPRPAPHAA